MSERMKPEEIDIVRQLIRNLEATTRNLEAATRERDAAVQALEVLDPSCAACGHRSSWHESLDRCDADAATCGCERYVPMWRLMIDVAERELFEARAEVARLKAELATANQTPAGGAQ